MSMLHAFAESFRDSINTKLGAARFSRDELVRSLLPKIASHFPSNTIVGRNDVPYMTRYTLVKIAGYQMRLHQVHRGDEDGELHNHPWRWGLSLILDGGYRETRGLGGPFTRHRRFERGDLNLILAETFHRLWIEPGTETWTLFVTGPYIKSWGFLDVSTGKYTPWRDFVRAKGLSTEGAPGADGENT